MSHKQGSSLSAWSLVACANAFLAMQATFWSEWPWSTWLPLTWPRCFSMLSCRSRNFRPEFFGVVTVRQYTLWDLTFLIISSNFCGSLYNVIQVYPMTISNIGFVAGLLWPGNPGGLSLEGRYRLRLPAPATATDLRPAVLWSGHEGAPCWLGNPRRTIMLYIIWICILYICMYNMYT